MSNAIAIYLRKSRDEDNETRDVTLARHEKLLLEFCERNNLYVKKIYKEVVSGESIAARLEMQRLLVDITSGKYDGVVCIELERLSRGNQVDQAEILEVFKKTGTKIYTLNKTYDFSTDNEIDEEFFEFGLFMSRREYKVICRRLARGRSAALLEGYYTGSSLPYGFFKEKRGKGYVLIPNEEEAKIVRLIFDMYTSGSGIAAIAGYLADNGIKPRIAKAFCTNRIRQILENKTYIGYLKIQNKKIAEDWTLGKHEPLIDPNIFNQAQERLKSGEIKIIRDLTLKNPLSSLVKCGVCGYAMILQHSSNGHYLKCRAFRCDTAASKLDKIETKVIEELKEELKGFKYYLDNQAEEDKRKAESRLNEIKVISQAIIKKEKAIEACCEFLEDGVYTKEQYFKRVNTLNEEISSLQANLEALEAISDDKRESISSTVPILEKCLDKYYDLSIEDRNKVLKSFIEKIEYYRTDSTPRAPFDLKIFLKI